MMNEELNYSGDSLRKQTFFFLNVETVLKNAVLNIWQQNGHDKWVRGIAMQLMSLLAVAKVACENSRFSSLLTNGGRFGRRKV